MSPTLPSYATGEETIRGTISGFNGQYVMFVRDSRGFIDVTPHPGTIINPRGLRLQPGMPLTILGHAQGSTFVADEIDTPYNGSGWYAPSWYGSSWYGPGWYGPGWYGPGWYGAGWYGPYFGAVVIVGPRHHVHFRHFRFHHRFR